MKIFEGIIDVKTKIVDDSVPQAGTDDETYYKVEEKIVHGLPGYARLLVVP